MKIYINDLEIEAIIGILECERVKKQKVVADIEIEYSYIKGCFLDYKKVSDIVSEMIIQNRYEILEDALIDITKKLKKTFSQIESLKIKLFKPDILKNCKVGVQLYKKF